MSSDRIITLELRQQNANNVNSNGDYKTLLQTPITIEEGDEIVVSNSFLDTTTATNTTVNLEDDISIEMTFFPWVNNIFGDSKTIVPALDGCKHVPCSVTSHGGGLVGFVLIDSIAVCVAEEYDIDSWGNVTILFNYIDINNTIKKISVYVDPAAGNIVFTQQIGLGIIAKEGSFSLDPTSNPVVLGSPPYWTQVTFDEITQALVDTAKADDVPISGIISQPITQAQSFHQVTFQKDITIKAGEYSPDEFAAEFTKQMTINLQSATDKRNPYGVRNNLLQASYEFSALTFVNAESSFVEPRDDVISTGFTYVNDITNSVWVGTNQFDLTYDSETSSYVIQDLHMPIYVDGNKVAIQFTTGTGGVFPALAYSGICITDLTALNLRTKQPIPNFAFNVMGLELGKLAPTVKYVEGTVLGSPGSLFPNLIFKVGENFTSAFNGIDLRVSKDLNDTAQADLSNFTKVNLTDKIVSIVGDSTDSIIGDNIFSSGSYTFGYYKIEINSGFKNLLVGEETIQRNIMAIVSKYYESESYTDGIDGIPYIHKGVPLQLSSLGVRILNSDNVIPDTLGSDNTVFIRITKAIQPVNKPA
jgi:hypothetical protein